MFVAENMVQDIADYLVMDRMEVSQVGCVRILSGCSTSYFFRITYIKPVSPLIITKYWKTAL